jgi:hypothetical protein
MLYAVDECRYYDIWRRQDSHYLGVLATCGKRLSALSCLSVRLPASNKSASTGRILMEFDIYFFSNTPEKIKVLLKCDKKNCHFTYIYDNMSLNFFLKREMLQTNFVRKITTHILCSIFFFRKSCRF